MSTKARTRYVCSECGAVSPKWAGQCGDCSAWNSLTEELAVPAGGVRRAGYAGAAAAGEVADQIGRAHV